MRLGDTPTTSTADADASAIDTNFLLANPTPEAEEQEKRAEHESFQKWTRKMDATVFSDLHAFLTDQSRSSDIRFNNMTQAESEVKAPVAVKDDDSGALEINLDEVDGSGSNFFETLFDGMTVVKPASAKPISNILPAFKMDGNRRGTCVIFNQVKFKLDLLERNGSDIDAASLQKCFTALGFEAEIYTDYTADAIKSLLKIIAKQNHSKADCFVCCFLSHGGENEVIYASDDTLRVPDLTAPFKGDVCESLVGKPKLFFIQACRGLKYDDGVKVNVSDDVTDGSGSHETRIPSEADFLIAYSGVPGYYCWRNADRGSWFMQSLCEILRKYADKLDLLTMMTLVNAKVAYDYESKARGSLNRKKQIPCIVSMLTRQVWFT